MERSGGSMALALNSTLWPFVMKLVLVLLAAAALLGSAAAGPAAYGICQTGCNALAVACYGAAGVVMGVGSVPTCNVALGLCMAACVAAGAAPTP
ncbi:Adenylosuccinate synthetase [Frankliniella fusca]|uniref:Adenylosuccinate synthetase n=1 Tax=Frankliniella fusca TaxID=407009 RepID=A0AAE1HPB2_9NEOP|nr:Adenylosuccinate synthetase [Frankliniella fusca]